MSPEAGGRPYDIAVIGGGVNGCGIARDAAGRGLRVVLAEQGDLAQATSSASTKLFHGGLRYLEHYEFRLVREALRERETLLRAMPHISWPLRFVLPHHAGLRPAWLLRLGLFIYDHLGGRDILPGTRTLDLRSDPAGAPLRDEYAKAFEYSDCWVDDARLVVLNARDAAARGATILTRARCESAARRDGIWDVQLVDVETGATQTMRARALVNAAGPWAEEVIRDRLHGRSPAHIRLVRGSHIVTRQLFDHGKPYIFQQTDGRIIFAIPYEGDFTLLGTTDCDHEGDPLSAACTEQEVAYLCRAASEYFREPVTPGDVVWTYSGVRPLFDDGSSSASEASRDYTIKVADEAGRAPLLSVFGGKITTYRRLSEAALRRLGPYFLGLSGPWTAGAPLPGGAFPVDGFDALVEGLCRAFPFLAERHARRLARAYGTDAATLLEGARSMTDLGETFGWDLTERELRWLMTREWARTADDVLWRRSKLGLRLSKAEVGGLADWMRRNRANDRSCAAE